MSTFSCLKQHRCFEGSVRFLEHNSDETRTKMKISCFVPDRKINGCVIWLSGLTCTEENFITKAGAQKLLSDLGLVVICPDTSPRGLNLPGERDHWDFGQGAGFYVDALTPGYKDHYRMYSYVANELYTLVVNEFNVQGRLSIMGHSMGGHGALVLGLREPSKFKSVSAFSPIVNPTACPWGQKAFNGYFGDQANSLGKMYDACELIKSAAFHPVPFLIDQGDADQFLDTQLRTSEILEAAKGTRQKITLNMRPGYDHSYYFISSFIDDHLRFHAGHIGG